MFLISLPCIMHNLVSMVTIVGAESTSPPLPRGKKRHFSGCGEKGIQLVSLRNCDCEEIAPLYLFSSQTPISLVILAM